MTDEQSIPISLASTLDINSHDMLVSASKPTFAFNRQKYQGSLLQNSIRYEADGWFAGWWGHNFDLVIDAEDTITPELGDPKQLSVIRQTDDNNRKVYVIKHKDLGLRYTYNPELWHYWITGKGDIKRTSDTEVSITAGETNKGDKFTATVDPYTGFLTAFDDVGSVGLKGTSYKDGEGIRLEVIRDVKTSLSDYIELRTYNIPIVATVPLHIYKYEKATGLSTWNNLISLKVDSATAFNLETISPSFAVDGTPVLSGYGTKDEQVVANIKDITIDHLVYTFQYKSYWVQDLFATTVPLSDGMSQQVSALENGIFAELLEQGSTDLVYDNSCVFRLGLPIWIQHYLDFDYRVAFMATGYPEVLKDFKWIIALRADNEEEKNPPISISGFLSILNSTGVVSTVSFMLPRTNPTDPPKPSPHNAVVEASPGMYSVVQPNNPRYSLLTLDLSGFITGNLLIPTTFQPYGYEENPNYDPRPVVSAGDALQTYGLTWYGKAQKVHLNYAKYEQAKQALTIADIKAIPDSSTAYFVPEYVQSSGTIGDDLINNPFGYQPDPTLPNYDPRPVVHAIAGVLDPAVKTWTIGDAAKNNTAKDTVWGIEVTPNYTRYWLKSVSIWQVDWNTELEIGDFWSLYWPTLPVPTLPIIKPDRANPYLDQVATGVIPAFIEITTEPDTTLQENQPMSPIDETTGEGGEILPPLELPYEATLNIGNFSKKSILHSTKNITDKTKWYWAFKLTRITNQNIRVVISRAFNMVRSFRFTTIEYFDSDAKSVGKDDPLVWKPITENFPGMVVYDRAAATDKNTGKQRKDINDTWVLYLKCVNGEAQFPIPVTDFNDPDKDGSNYFQLALYSNGGFSSDQTLINLSPIVSWHIAEYTDGLYKDNYKVLNRINLTRNGGKDPGIFSGTNMKAVLNIPLCVPGYAVSKITTPRILNSDLSAFDLENGVIDTASYMWRIDNRGLGYSYDLNLVEGSLTSVQLNSNSLYVAYKTTGIGPFYQLTKVPYSVDSSTSNITGYQDYAYPDWILRNLVPITGANVGSYTENEYTKIYIPGAQSASVIANVTVLLKTLDFIEQINAEHKYDSTAYNGQLFKSVSPQYTVTKPEILITGGVETHNQVLVLSPSVTSTDKFTAVYNPDTTELVGDPIVEFTDWIYVDYTIAGITGKKVSSITVNIQSPEVYELIFRRTLITNKTGLMLPVTGILQQEGKRVELDPESYGIIDLSTNRLDNSTKVSFMQSDVIDDVVKIYVQVNNSAVVNFKPVGIVSRNNSGIIYDVSSTASDLIFEYKDVTYTLHLDTRTDLKQYLSYKCTDIRDGKTREVYQYELNDIRMFVKQFWSSTVDVENFWWIDSEHVLELSKYNVTLYKKVGLVDSRQSVHDWNGDNWKVENVRKRSAVISTEDLYYSVSSAYKTSGILFKLRHTQSLQGVHQVQVLYIDPLETQNWDLPSAWSVVTYDTETIPLLVGEEAKPLSHDTISSYGPLNIDSLITTTKISSTTVGLQGGSRTLLIGIKQNNGLGQWCLKISVDGKESAGVVVGYGCVGPKGELTGGQIPIDYCDYNGFNGIVQELTEGLPETIDKLETIPRLIVGTSSQQWFIQETMTGIISHLTFNPSIGTHVPVPLYLNNNVAVRKNFTSYRGSRLQDLLPQSLNIASLLGQDNPAINVLMGIISPSFWYLNIFYSVFVGIATALGSYSYTWRNSNEIRVRGTESLTDQDKSFGKYEFNKSLRINNQNMHAWAQIIVHMVGALPETVAQVVVNKSQGQSATDDSAGRKFSQLFEDSIASTLSTAIDSSGFNVRVQSIIKHQYSLTSFYSINDKIECHAGPGFVNHNLKAQCTAQSMQDIQIDGKQLGYFSALTALTKLTLGAQITVLQAAYDALQRSHDSVAQQSTEIAFAASINWGYFASLGISAAMLVTGGILKLNNMILDNLDSLVEAFGGKTEAFLNNWLSAHTPIQEGLHTYGNKSMTFFWPAFGITKPNTYTNEGVAAKMETVDITLSMTGALDVYISTIDESDADDDDLYIFPFETGRIDKTGNTPESARIPVIKCLGTIIPPDASDSKKIETEAPENMTVIEGTTSFLNQTAFKNEQIGVGPPVFGPPMIHDYMIDKEWALGYTAGAGAIISVSCDDTKLIDGGPSNIVITDDFCGVASSYIALEIKKTFDEAYLRPTMITTNAIGLNINRVNCVHDAKAYHAFDGQVNRIVSWVGGQGMDKELLYQQYLFQMNDHFKRSNIFPPAQFYGNFQGPPVVSIRSYENEIVSNTIVEQTTGLGFGTSTPGENRNLQRFSTCVFSELLSVLPTTIRTLAPYKLRVNDGVTCLVTELRNTNSRYKAPTSLDFNIGTRLYRKTEEYIVEITEKSGVVMTETRTPSAGLEFIGPTMTAAYFYSPATKLYYEYAGGTEIQKQDILNRFKNVHNGLWDFVNQEVIFNARLSYTGEEMVLRLDGGINGEVWPPNKTIYNERSGYKIYSCAGGLVYQGPKRFIVSRFVTLEHMIHDIKKNKRKWKRLDREQFVYERDYGWEYEDWYTETPLTAVSGWTHNPFLLVTSMLGTAEDIDNKFEWELTFAWSELLEHLIEQNEYVTVNVMAETVTQGGVVRQRPTHIYLSKEVFTRSDNAGYYTIKFQSNSGIGNRERLFIWSDGIVAKEDLKIACKQMTSSRTQPLITQVDLERLEEF